MEIISNPYLLLCLLEDYGEYLKAQPYTRVYQINLCEMEKSMRFNPFVFLRKQSEIPRLIANIMKKTVRRTWMDQIIITVGTAELRDRAENAQLSILERIR